MSEKNTDSQRVPPYMQCYAAQLGAIGHAGQRRLQRASVLIVGAGGVGNAVSSVLATAGVGRLVVLDPQRFDVENFNRTAFTHEFPVGKRKVDVLATGLNRRPHLTVVPVVGRGESLDTVAAAERVDLIVSASNTVRSRIAIARFACSRRVRHVSAAITDGRIGFGGVVSAWAPNNEGVACPACFLTPHAVAPRGEALLSPVVATVGSIAAFIAIRLLIATVPQAVLTFGNCLTIDLNRYTMEYMRVMRRPDCMACTHRR